MGKLICILRRGEQNYIAGSTIMEKIKKHFLKIICTVAAALIVSAVGAVVGVYVNDKIQDSKIDIMARNIDKIGTELIWLKNYLIARP